MKILFSTAHKSLKTSLSVSLVVFLLMLTGCNENNNNPKPPPPKQQGLEIYNSPTTIQLYGVFPGNIVLISATCFDTTTINYGQDRKIKYKNNNETCPDTTITLGSNTSSFEIVNGKITDEVAQQIATNLSKGFVDYTVKVTPINENKGLKFTYSPSSGKKSIHVINTSSIDSIKTDPTGKTGDCFLEKQKFPTNMIIASPLLLKNNGSCTGSFEIGANASANTCQVIFSNAIPTNKSGACSHLDWEWSTANTTLSFKDHSTPPPIRNWTSCNRACFSRQRPCTNEWGTMGIIL